MLVYDKELIPGNKYNEAADLSSDGMINVLDVIQLMNLILDA